ncbi:MAG: hypothetical protein U0175_30720 [Caldilineaceae bacterium]
MSILFSDTTPEAEAKLIELLRAAPPWRKIEMMEQLNRRMKMLLMAGLKQRHPNADDAELRRRMADLLLGPELASTVYGPYDR